MYAVVEIAGQQFRVEQDKNIKVPLLHEEPGKKVTLDRVLFYTDAKGKHHLGTPLVKNVKVEAKVVEHGRDKKVIVFKKKRRKGYRVKNGHRQHFTLLRIEKIATTRAKKATAPKAEETGEAKEE
ncbi:MAG: 50S ribosomal protein L21 [Calditrichaeota bacterium]|nr:50S ribosomal protein L21 [Calditrichota bacterium]